MKANAGQIRAALDHPRHRLILLHGPDAGLAAELSARLGKTMGDGAERVDLDGPALKADPALLGDEAASMSLFGGKRLILVEGGGDELLDAVNALLDAPAAGNPVAIVTGALKKTSKLLALAEASPRVLANAAYLPEGRDAERIVVELGRAAGLDDEQIVEVIAHVALNLFTNYVNVALDVPVDFPSVRLRASAA